MNLISSRPLTTSYGQIKPNEMFTVPDKYGEALLKKWDFIHEHVPPEFNFLEEEEPLPGERTMKVEAPEKNKVEQPTEKKNGSNRKGRPKSKRANNNG